MAARPWSACLLPGTAMAGDGVDAPRAKAPSHPDRPSSWRAPLIVYQDQVVRAAVIRPISSCASCSVPRRRSPPVLADATGWFGRLVPPSPAFVSTRRRLTPLRFPPPLHQPSIHPNPQSLVPVRSIATCNSPERKRDRLDLQGGDLEVRASLSDHPVIMDTLQERVNLLLLSCSPVRRCFCLVISSSFSNPACVPALINHWS